MTIGNYLSHAMFNRLAAWARESTQNCQMLYSPGWGPVWEDTTHICRDKEYEQSAPGTTGINNGSNFNASSSSKGSDGGREHPSALVCGKVPAPGRGLLGKHAWGGQGRMKPEQKNYHSGPDSAEKALGSPSSSVVPPIGNWDHLPCDHRKIWKNGPWYVGQVSARPLHLEVQYPAGRHMVAYCWPGGGPPDLQCASEDMQPPFF